MSQCVFTTVYEEHELFPHWISYYSKHFDDVFVCIHSPEDSSVTPLQREWGFQIVLDDFPMRSRHVDDWEKHHAYVRETQQKLLRHYTWVLYAHADEFVVPDPDKYKGLRDYIASCKKDYVYCTGYEPIHMQGEDDIDWSRPILPQRQCMVADVEYNKPLLSRVPLNWRNGFHRVSDTDDLATLADPDLYLFHMQKVDLKMFTRRSTFRPPFLQVRDDCIEIPERFKKVI